jgi:YbbR domain-containing protein
VAGPQEVLDQIAYVNIEPITLDNAAVDSTLHASVILPEGVVALEPKDVEATIQISMILENRVYQAVDVAVKNLAGGLSCTIAPESVNVTVTGSQEALAKISASKIKPFVDLSGLGEGTHTATVKFENEPDIDATISSSSATVQVKLKKR